MGDDLASDDEYLFDAGLIDSNNRGTAILSSDDEDDEDIAALKESAISSVPSKKRKNNNDTNAEGDDISSKKRNKKKKKEKVVPTNSKNVLIHAGRGIALDSTESQSMFLNTLYSHATKLSEGDTTTGTANKDNLEENEDTTTKEDTTFSFQQHLYQAPTSVDTKTNTYNHSNIAAYLKSGALPSNKRLKNWKHSHSPMVLVITISARRAVELMKQLSSEIKLPICKLFAKHMKVEEQAELLCNGVGGSKNNNQSSSSGGGGNNKKKAKYYSLAVGTPNRLLKLLQHTEGEGGGPALRLNHTELIIIDCHTDSKGWNVCTLKDTSSDLMEVLRMGVIPQLEKRTGKVKLGLY